VSLFLLAEVLVLVSIHVVASLVYEGGENMGLFVLFCTGWGVGGIGRGKGRDGIYD
jgi:hypothetical protein